MVNTYEEIKRLAKEKHLSVAKVEQYAGLSPGTLAKWNDHVPRADNLKAVAEVLKVKMEKLI